MGLVDLDEVAGGAGRMRTGAPFEGGDGGRVGLAVDRQAVEGLEGVDGLAGDLVEGPGAGPEPVPEVGQPLLDLADAVSGVGDLGDGPLAVDEPVAVGAVGGD